MRKETRISKISIVCALGMMVAGTAFAASPVRSLGGSGTYTSASSAASSKAVTSTRAGTMRVMPTTPTRVVAGSSNGGSVSAGAASSSGAVAVARGGSTPRLSIGKYLANKATVSGGVSGGGSNGGSDGEFADKFVTVEGNVEELKVRIDGIDVAVNELDGRVSALEGRDTVTGEELEAVSAAVAAVQDAVDALPESMAKEEIESLVAGLLNESGVETQAGLTELKNSLDSLAERMVSVESLAGIVSGLELDVAGLESGVAGLQSDVSGLGNRIAGVEGAMTKYLERPTDSGYYVLQVGGESAQWLSVEFVEADDVVIGDSNVEPGDDVVGGEEQIDELGE